LHNTNTTKTIGVEFTCSGRVGITCSTFGIRRVVTTASVVAVSLIGGGNRGTRRKTPTCPKTQTNLSHNVVSSILRHECENLIWDNSDIIEYRIKGYAECNMIGPHVQHVYKVELVYIKNKCGHNNVLGTVICWNRGENDF
jgi:hypothetical protein